MKSAGKRQRDDDADCFEDMVAHQALAGKMVRKMLKKGLVPSLQHAPASSAHHPFFSLDMQTNNHCWIGETYTNLSNACQDGLDSWILQRRAPVPLLYRLLSDPGTVVQGGALQTYTD